MLNNEIFEIQQFAFHFLFHKCLSMTLSIPAHTLIKLPQINCEQNCMCNFSQPSPASIISVIVGIIITSSGVNFPNRRWHDLVKILFVTSARSSQLNFVNYWHILRNISKQRLQQLLLFGFYFVYLCFLASGTKNIGVIPNCLHLLLRRLFLIKITVFSCPSTNQSRIFLFMRLKKRP